MTNPEKLDLLDATLRLWDPFKHPFSRVPVPEPVSLYPPDETYQHSGDIVEFYAETLRAHPADPAVDIMFWCNGERLTARQFARARAR
jgi:hypothetical protein